MTNVHALVCFPYPPVHLAPNKPATIGRLPGNQVVLPVPIVSRTHARVEQRNGIYWIQDLKSSNGIKVNGHKVTESQLAEGDVIRIGPFDIKFQSLAPFDPTKTHVATESGGSEIPDAGTKANAGSALSGKLEDIGVLHAFQFLELSKQTGTALFHTPNGEARVIFFTGLLKACSFRGKEGIKALAALLLETEGEFRMVRDIPAVANPLPGSTTGALLLEALRLLDEEASR